LRSAFSGPKVCFQISQRQIDRLAVIIHEFGWTAPIIVDEDIRSALAMATIWRLRSYG